jgi:hypothetical protein
VALGVIATGMLIPTAQRPFFYYEMLNFPALSLLLPVLGMAALLPIVLRFAFGQAEAEALTPATAPEMKAPAPLEEHQLKTA